MLRLQQTIPQDPIGNEPVVDPEFEDIGTSVEATETPLGSSIKRPNRWSELRRHLRFGQMGDLVDIVKFDWPAVRGGLQKSLYAPDAPIPVGVSDLTTLARSQPRGACAEVSTGVFHQGPQRRAAPGGRMYGCNLDLCCKTDWRALGKKGASMYGSACANTQPTIPGDRPLLQHNTQPDPKRGSGHNV
jgi:hypothetical protein